MTISRYFIAAFFGLFSLSSHAEIINADVAEISELNSQGVTVVDIRLPQEWNDTGVIAGSKLLTYSDAHGRVTPDWVEKMKAIAPPDQPVALICRTGGRSADAARLLDRSGYQKVYNVEGGIFAWKGSNMPVVPPSDAIVIGNP